MTTQKRKFEEETSGAEVGEWIVTFSDCMTLLLCFFVLLLTFSSFEEVEAAKFAGIMKAASNTSIFNILHEAPESVVPPPEAPIDRTEQGSEKPTKQEPKEIQKPKKPLDIVSIEAFSDRIVYRIPSSELFVANAIQPTLAGRTNYLYRIGKVMEMFPRNMIVAESGPGQPGTGAPRPAGLGLERACAIVDYFVREAGIDPSRFSVAAEGLAPSGRYRGVAVVEITLLAERTYK